MSWKLKDMKVSDKAVISGFEKGNENYRKKLLSLGLTRGTEIQLVKYAPLGDPVEILVRGFHLSLRKEEAEIILLEEGGNEK